MVIYEDILRDFQKQKVKYVLVGGIAVNLLGSMRTTADMDILVEMSDSNLAKVVRILTRRGYTVKQPVNPMGIADAKIRKEWIEKKHMKAFNFYKNNELKEVDIIIDSPVSYRQAKNDALIITAGGLKISVISLANLIKMKKNTGRPIDRLDVEELRRIKRIGSV